MDNKGAKNQSVGSVLANERRQAEADTKRQLAAMNYIHSNSSKQNIAAIYGGSKNADQHK